ncbi:MAG: APC family permease [Methyloligellaceae bacterium]
MPPTDRDLATQDDARTLKRSLTLPLAVLYGLGVTIGAGIYVLIGATAARAGLYAPAAFVLAALVMAPAAGAFAEFAGRLPVSAGEAAYVRAGFHSGTLSLIVGLMVVAAGSVSAATVSVGSAGYIRDFVDLPDTTIIVAVVFAMGGVAAWGIVQSVSFAALFTLIEVAGLVLIVWSGFAEHPELPQRLPELLPATVDAGAWAGILGAGLLAFFAFIGFEDLVNIAEEVKHPRRTLPWAIFLTLVLTTLIYVLVVAVAVLTVPLGELGASRAPLSLVFAHVTGLSPAAISAIAIVATLNGVIVQIIMASRVIYGLAGQGSLPAALGQVSAVTHTPVVATGLVVLVILVLALAFPLESLAEMTSRITLSIFVLVCAALLKLKIEGVPAPEGAFVVPGWVPLLGILSCSAFLLTDLVG